MSDAIDYKALMHDAFRNVMVEALRTVAEHGLPGNHHFYITFDTSTPGVEIADWMKEQFPDEMTIVMQEWFDNLFVMDDKFGVTLNFSNVPEPMIIPFNAVRSFTDPSVEFGLRFEATEMDVEPPDETPPTQPSGPSDVVSLDAFRKS